MALPVLAFPVIASFLMTIIKPIIKQVLIALGLSLVVFTGMELAMDPLFDYLYTAEGNFSSLALYTFKASGFESCVNMWAGAISGMIAFQQLTKGAQMVWKKPGAAYGGIQA